MAKKNNRSDFDLIAHKSPRSAVSEAYRTLRTNLGFSSLDQPCRSIAVTSSGPEDGKSTTISNLGIVLAQAGNKVILVDCDLRKPVQHRVFGVENNRGLTNCLLQDLDPSEVVQKGPNENLTLLTSGPIPPNPAELLGTTKVKSFWALLLERYDYVLIDCPPVLAVTDAVLLSTQVDGVILVVGAGSRIEAPREAKEQLLKANANILGVVINKVRIRQGDYYYYYYYYGNEEENTIKL